MDIVVSGHHCTVSEKLKTQVEQRMEKLTRLRDQISRVEVDFTGNDANRSRADAFAAQITLRSKGPVIRSEARAGDKMDAFEGALERLKTQLRRASDRRKAHRGLRLSDIAEPTPIAAETPEQAAPLPAEEPARVAAAGLVVFGDGPLVVKEKEFSSAPLTLAQALDEMELVGHNFFLYQDLETGRPSVVYRRKAYNYGVIHLNVE
ncbi:MAG: ribosomal subunit interface protein [Arachnia propionica]|nr:MAG: ribosomal subunit interface protein [Arachnia propionica]